MKLKKLSALLLAAVMVFTAAPLAYAEETPATEESTPAKAFDAYSIDATSATTKVDSYKNKLAKRIYNLSFKKKADKGIYPGFEADDALYAVFTLKRSGYKNDAFYQKVAKKLTTQAKEIAKKGKTTGNFSGQKKEISWGSVETENHLTKISLCASSLGLNPKNLGGLNLIKEIAKKTNYEASSAYPTSREMMMLLAFNYDNYSLPASSSYVTRDQLIGALTGDAIDEKIKNSYGYVDEPVMMISPLMPYYSQKAVGEAYEKVDAFLATEAKNTDETTNFVNNSYSMAQVLLTMGENRLQTFGGFSRDAIIAYANKAAEAELKSEEFTDLSRQLLSGYASMSYALAGNDATLYRTIANPVKSVKANAKTVTIKKGKKAKVVYTVTTADDRASFGSYRYNTKTIAKIAKVTAKADNHKLTLTLKAKKAGKKNLVVVVGGKKTTVKVVVK
ncbi:hypothetical protein SAMN05216391_11174 [Lachnospiraceae bacterium KHCPX20]|nr:hypothetical protein SAMN05216391_11174 [Lachnospiraceae bacterium KHCPX20]